MPCTSPLQVGIGIFTKSTAEYTKRGENFNKELDFVAANIVMALVADFMLVWLPAPTLSFAYAHRLAPKLPCAHHGACMRHEPCCFDSELSGCMLYTDLLNKAHLPSLSLPFTENLQLESRARSSAKRGGLAAFLASCPENAFQKVLFLA